MAPICCKCSQGGKLWVCVTCPALFHPFCAGATEKLAKEERHCPCCDLVSDDEAGEAKTESCLDSNRPVPDPAECAKADATSSKFRVTCPSCSRQYILPSVSRGKPVRCDDCPTMRLVETDLAGQQGSSAQAEECAKADATISYFTVICPSCSRQYLLPTVNRGEDVGCDDCPTVRLVETDLAGQQGSRGAGAQ